MHCCQTVAPPPAYGFEDENQFMDNKNPFEEGMRLFKAGTDVHIFPNFSAHFLHIKQLFSKQIPNAQTHTWPHCKCSLLGELKQAILAFQADVQQHDDSSEVKVLARKGKSPTTHITHIAMAFESCLSLSLWPPVVTMVWFSCRVGACWDTATPKMIMTAKPFTAWNSRLIEMPTTSVRACWRLVLAHALPSRISDATPHHTTYTTPHHTICPAFVETLLALGVSYVNELDHTKALKSLKTWVQHNPKFMVCASHHPHIQSHQPPDALSHPKTSPPFL